MRNWIFTLVPLMGLIAIILKWQCKIPILFVVISCENKYNGYIESHVLSDKYSGIGQPTGFQG